MRSMMKALMIGIFLLCKWGVCLTQTVPGTLSYQGILMQSDGITPLTDGAHSIEFNFYTSATAGTLLQTRTISVTTIKGYTRA